MTRVSDLLNQSLTAVKPSPIFSHTLASTDIVSVLIASPLKPGVSRQYLLYTYFTRSRRQSMKARGARSIPTPAEKRTRGGFDLVNRRAAS